MKDLTFKAVLNRIYLITNLQTPLRATYAEIRFLREIGVNDRRFRNLQRSVTELWHFHMLMICVNKHASKISYVKFHLNLILQYWMLDNDLIFPLSNILVIYFIYFGKEKQFVNLFTTQVNIKTKNEQKCNYKSS